MRPHRRQPTRLRRPWDSPGKNTGVGYHFLLHGVKVKSESEVAQSCPTLSDPMDCSLPGSSVHGIFQARVLEWVVIAFSNKTPRGEHRQNTLWHKSQQDPLCPTSQSNGNKSKNKQRDLIELKSFCTMKETISKVKRQPSGWEKIIAKEATDWKN